MATKSVPERLIWAVETLGCRPDDRVLEIGCGRGVAVELLCARLSGGQVTAIDRSAKAIEAAERHNAGHVAADRAVFEVADLASADLAGRRFDKIFAVNVNHFWVRDATAELDRLIETLDEGGALFLFYEPPSSAKAAEVTARLHRALTPTGHTVTVSRSETSRSGVLLCFEVRPSGAAVGGQSRRPPST